MDELDVRQHRANVLRDVWEMSRMAFRAWTRGETCLLITGPDAAVTRIVSTVAHDLPIASLAGTISAYYVPRRGETDASA